MSIFGVNAPEPSQTAQATSEIPQISQEIDVTGDLPQESTNEPQSEEVVPKTQNSYTEVMTILEDLQENIDLLDVELSSSSSEPLIDPDLPAEEKIMKTIKVINYIPTQGLNREFSAYDWDKFDGENIPDSERPDGFVFPSDSNYVTIGILVEDGDVPIGNAVLTIESTDTTQNKVMNGTNQITTIYPDGKKKFIPIYSYQYKFKTPGTHTIVFKVDDVIEEITINVN